MAMVADQNLAEYLAALAAPTPVPAGGSAAAVTAAQGAALLAMAARITEKRGPSHGAASTGAPDLAALAAEADAHIGALLALAEADSRAFTALLAARRAQRHGDPAAAAAVRAAHHAVIETPLTVCTRCVTMLEQAALLAGIYRDTVAPDAWAGVQLLLAGARISLSNARLNLGATTDDVTTDGAAADGDMAPYAATVARTATALDEAEAAATAAFARIHEGGRP